MGGTAATARGATRFAARMLDTYLGAPLAWRRRLAVFRNEPDVPILVGPWIDEVGYELLYWIPFLRSSLRRAGLEPRRVVAVSRGGVAGWYADVAARYVDILDFWDPHELVAAHRSREQHQDGGQRQWSIAPEDEVLIGAVAARLEVDRFHLLHPAWMYRLLAGYLGGPRPASHLLDVGDHSPLGTSYPRPDWLPADEPYLAVKFYTSRVFPRTPENQALVDRTLAQLAERATVVVLHIGTQLDEHVEFDVTLGGNVVDAREHVAPARENLARQSAVVAHSDGFVGTYGGFSYLAPLLGVRSRGVFSTTDFLPTHLATASIVLNRAGAGGFSAVHARLLELLVERTMVSP
jgi:hypothetical protein